jgi:hypothetical protein
MRTSCTALALALLSLGVAYPQTEAADRCLAETVIGGHPVRMTHCVLWVLDGSGANILFSKQPLSYAEVEGFLIRSNGSYEPNCGRASVSTECPLSADHCDYRPSGFSPALNGKSRGIAPDGGRAIPTATSRMP